MCTIDEMNFYPIDDYYLYSIDPPPDIHYTVEDQIPMYSKKRKKKRSKKDLTWKEIYEFIEDSKEDCPIIPAKSVNEWKSVYGTICFGEKDEIFIKKNITLFAVRADYTNNKKLRNDDFWFRHEPYKYILYN